MAHAGILVLAGALLALCSSTALAQQSAPACPVKYNMQSNSKEFDPLLLGGVYDRCESGCQPRTDTW